MPARCHRTNQGGPYGALKSVRNHPYDGIRTLQILRVTGKVEAVRCREADGVSRIFNDVHHTTEQARQKLSLLADLVGVAQIEVPDRTLLNVHIAPLRSGMELSVAAN